MFRALKGHTHRVGVFLQARPLAATGSLEIDQSAFPAFPALPPVER